jgi:hypothetical protein
MQINLNPIEARVLGVLIEKQMSTPDYYPLTLNALVNACNQKTNRDPVLEMDQSSVEQALDSLRSQRLAWQVKVQGSRSLKYEHNMKSIVEFSDRELAVLCELMLRGPQTVGELRTRTTRLTDFPNLAVVEQTIQKLETHENGPFVAELPRRPGQKENRYAHLFSDIDPSDLSPEPLTIIQDMHPQNERLEILEKKVEDLSRELNALKEQFLTFKEEFE